MQATADPPSRRPGRTLYLHVFSEALRPTLFALFGLTLVVLSEQFMGLTGLVISREVGTLTVLQLALLQAVPIASQMFPFAVLVGSLVAMGRLGADREILALESLGVSGSRLVWPILAFSAVMTLVALPLSLSGRPAAGRQLDREFARIFAETPWAHLQPKRPQHFGGWQLEALEVSPRGDELGGVLLWMPDPGETIFAERGELGSGDEGLTLTLFDGGLIRPTEDGPREVRFERLDAALPRTEVAGSTSGRLEAAPLDELARAAREFVPAPRAELPLAAMELHRRFSIPFATLVFGFLAAPLFFARRTYSRSSGVLLGLLCTGAYYGLVQFGTGLVAGGTLTPAQASWLPNAVLLAIGVWLFFRARRKQVLGLPPRGREPRFRERRRAGRDPDPEQGRLRRRLRVKRMPLPRYVAARYLQLVAITFAGLLSAYLLIDVMDRLSWFARYEATTWEALRFYFTRLPLLASHVTPMALLVATALLVSLLAVEGELIGMRACGIPAPRAMLPALLITLVVAPLYLLFKNFVVPYAYVKGEELKRNEIKREYNARAAARTRAPVWMLAGSRLVEASRFDIDRGWAREITIYDLDRSGRPETRTDAASARHIGNGVWRLEQPSRIEATNGHARTVPAPAFVSFGDDLRAEVDTRLFSIAELAEEIDELEANEQDTKVFRIDFHVRLAESLSCLLLPAVVLFFAVGGPPFPGSAQNLLVAAALGVSYILLTSVSASLGHKGALPPVLAGWSPTLVFGSLAGFLGLRMMRRL